MTINTEMMGDFTGDVMEYGGEYSIELWFPLEGGAAVQQRNTLTLTEYRDRFIGDSQCHPCEWTLDPGAYDPVSFNLDATLSLESITEGERVADELVYRLTDVPVIPVSGTVKCPCPGAADTFIDPAVYSTLSNWFIQGVRNPIHLNALENNTVEDFLAGPMYVTNIPDESLFYTIVDDLE